MRALSSRPFCSYDSRRVSLGYLSAGLRYTTRFTDGHRIRLSQSFNARSNVGHFTQCQLLLTPLSSHFPNNDQPCMDAHAESKLDTFILLKTGIEVSHASKNS